MLADSNSDGGTWFSSENTALITSFYLNVSGFQLTFDLRYKIFETGNQSSEELKASCCFSMFTSCFHDFAFQFKHHSRTFSVLF